MTRHNIYIYQVFKCLPMKIPGRFNVQAYLTGPQSISFYFRNVFIYRPINLRKNSICVHIKNIFPVTRCLCTLDTVDLFYSDDADIKKSDT